MATIRDENGDIRTVLPCRVCGELVYFGLTAKGKRCPYDMDADGNATRVSHFTTCTRVDDWTAAHPKKSA